jgi:hypothetical protein
LRVQREVRGEFCYIIQLSSFRVFRDWDMWSVSIEN